MKMYKKIIAVTLANLVAVACDNDGYIDPISKVDPGPDEAAPSVAISYPTGDIVIPFTETETSLNIEFEVTDDIEIESIVVSLDGAQIASFNNFLDYRRSVDSYLQENIPIGEHTLEVTATDLSGKSTGQMLDFEITNKYSPKYDGEIFFMPFEGDVYMDLVTETNATVVGGPGFDTGKSGKAYKGLTGAYLTFPTAGLVDTEFSATFWYKANASPDRAGILVIGPPDEANPTAQNDRTSGFRFFREGSATNQIFKLNVGNGTADSWFDGGAAASLNPGTAGWVHMAFTISETECVVYFNGQVVKQGAFTGVDWTDCDILSIASGDPRFTEWGHLSDGSLIDELRLFNKALSPTEIQTIMSDN